jgi:predicted 3-demethylubiquinone-9 3-methyltransferase (glyoxalase superfamily)
MSKITPCLWFDDTAEEAARSYVDIPTLQKAYEEKE